MEPRRSPLAQGTGSNNVINVYPDRVELSSGWHGQNTLSVGLKQIATVSIRGLINCTLTIEINDGRRLSVERMALPDARQVKAAVEDQKRRAGLFE
jgi:Bacterial PH domain